MTNWYTYNSYLNYEELERILNFDNYIEEYIEWEDLESFYNNNEW